MITYKLRKLLQARHFSITVTFFYVHELTNLREPYKRPDLVVQKLKKEEQERLLDVWPVKLEKIQKRFDNGDICYISLVDDRVVGYEWVQWQGRHPFQQIGNTIKIEPKDFWCYDLRVANDFQSQGISTYMNWYLLSEKKRTGFQRAWEYTDSKNFSNQRALEKSGFVLKRKIYSLKYDNSFLKLF
ncbi:GNAT family N-acetyltransferase [Marinilabilia salmonicolor]|uniref:GNAT family N-acetyltransferase n=1 Tax=Marinilabilia salmonicolor TaxID=989 RepID=UPI00029A69C0|nr:GNAT family N-acetyltransferase [Marinilabilia salmonicolor]